MRFQIVEPCQDVQEGEEKFGTEVKKLPTNTAESEGRESWPCAVTVLSRQDHTTSNPGKQYAFTSTPDRTSRAAPWMGARGPCCGDSGS